MTSAPFKHVPVLLDEVVEALAPKAGQTIVDGTFGGGSYSRAILDAADCRVIGIDRDPSAVARGREMAKSYADRLSMIEGRFGDMDTSVTSFGLAAVGGVALDLGVSSFQLDDGTRGFSFRNDGPLDMRMESDGVAGGGMSAADVVNTAEETDLANMIFRLGEEPRSRAVARAIVRARAEAPITRTRQLAEIVAKVVRAPPGRDPATRTFQALRLHVNDELGELERGLEAAERILSPSGRFAVVTFHSLEDRMVKRFFDRRSGRDRGTSRHLPPKASERAPTFRLLFSGHRGPGEGEIASNPRARSAKLRAAERTDAAAWGEGA